jgi:hypothetical protein
MFVKRVLLIRLAVVTVGAALIGGATTYYLKQQEIEKQVADLGRQAVSTLSVQVAAFIKYQKSTPVEALHQVLAIVPEYLADYRSGQFIFAQFYDSSGTIFAEASAPELRMMETLKGLINALPLSFPEAERSEVQTRQINDAIFVYFAAPFGDSQTVLTGMESLYYGRADGALSTRHQ